MVKKEDDFDSVFWAGGKKKKKKLIGREMKENYTILQFS